MATRGIDPEAYLEFVHDIDLGDLTPDASLGFAIERLPGRRYVFTNGCRHHAARILARLGMDHLFDEIWDIRTIGFVPKPDRRAYDRVVAQAGLAPDTRRHVRRYRPQSGAGPGLGHDHGLAEDRPWIFRAHAGAAEISLAARGHIDHETADLTVFLNSIRI